VAYPVAAILVLLAFLPKVGALFYLMPRAVAAAALVFSSTFIIVNGLQVMTSRLLDARKTLLIGLALLAALAVDAQPGFVRLMPQTWQPILGTSLVLGTLVGLALNIAFRVGMRRTQTLRIDPKAIDVERIPEFLQQSGEKWGARADVIERAKFNLEQAIETIVEGCDPEGPLEVDATFDEFSLDIRVSLPGTLAGASRTAADERGDHGDRGRASAPGGLHAAPPCRQGVSHASRRAVHHPLPLRPLAFRAVRPGFVGGAREARQEREGDEAEIVLEIRVARMLAHELQHALALAAAELARLLEQERHEPFDRPIVAGAVGDLEDPVAEDVEQASGRHFGGGGNVLAVRHDADRAVSGSERKGLRASGPTR
jgi:hypothetical protein